MDTPQTANGNCCIYCKNQLTVEVADGGKVPGSSFIRCYNGPVPGKPHYFHRFPPSAHVLPPINTAAVNPSAAPVVTLAQTVAVPQASSGRPLCPTPRCGSGRIQPNCSRKKCRRHCLQEAGPCGAHTHDKERKAPAAPSTLPVSYAGVLDFGSHDDWVSNTRVSLDALDAHQRREDAKRAAKERILDGLFGVKSPTPEREQQEDADLQLAMQLSLGQAQPRSSTPSSSRPIPGPSLRLPAAITTVGRLRTLSPSPESPEFPAMPSIPSPSSSFSTLAPSRAVAPGATSASRPLRITTQLNADWMETASSQSTFHVKNSRPLKTAKHLMVVYWDEDNKPHAVFYIHSFLTWPTWQVAHATGHFATLLGDNPDVEVYDPSFKTWASIGSTYPHPIIADKALLLRRRNTQCLKLDEVVNTFYPPASSAPMHFRKNLPAERKALRTVYKSRRSPKPIVIDDSSSSDSDVEVVRITKRALKQEDEDDFILPRPQRPRLDPVVVVVDDDDTPPLTASSSTSTFSSALPSPSAASPSRWPAGMYVVDMITGFQKMSGMKGRGQNRGKRFEAVFGVPYHASTFDAQHSKYKAATPTQVEAGVQAGRTDKGLWNVWRKML